MSLTSRTLVLTAGLSMGLAAALGTARAQDSNPAQERHEAMEAIRDLLGPLRAMAMKEAPFDAAQVKKSAGGILAHLKEAEGLFPEGSGGGDTRAKPEIWSDRAGFDASMHAAQEAAAALAAVTEEAAYEPAMRALGGSCRGCHEKYRAPEN